MPDMKLIAVTGHRPPKIGGYDRNSPRRQQVSAMMKTALEAAVVKFGSIGLITGGALGVDMDVTYVARELGVPYVICVPCMDHSSKWPAVSRDEFRSLIGPSSADLAERISPGNHEGGLIYCSHQAWKRGCEQVRNRFMVNNCDFVLAVWDGSAGGTANCVEYARSVGKPIKFVKLSKYDMFYGQK